MLIDSHIHLDKYREEDRLPLLAELGQEDVTGIITVSMDLVSCKENLELSRNYQGVFPAFGFHPEQALPSEEE